MLEMDEERAAEIADMHGEMVDAMEEAYATQMMMVALVRTFIRRGILSAGDMSQLIGEAVSMSLPKGPATPDEELMAERMRGRLAYLEVLLISPAGSRPNFQ